MTHLRSLLFLIYFNFFTVLRLTLSINDVVRAFLILTTVVVVFVFAGYLKAEVINVT